jgi:hypothetical protein
MAVWTTRQSIERSVEQMFGVVPSKHGLSDYVPPT